MENITENGQKFLNELNLNPEKKKADLTIIDNFSKNGINFLGDLNKNLQKICIDAAFDIFYSSIHQFPTNPFVGAILQYTEPTGIIKQHWRKIVELAKKYDLLNEIDSTSKQHPALFLFGTGSEEMLQIAWNAGMEYEESCFFNWHLDLAYLFDNSYEWLSEKINKKVSTEFNRKKLWNQIHKANIKALSTKQIGKKFVKIRIEEIIRKNPAIALEVENFLGKTCGLNFWDTLESTNFEPHAVLYKLTEQLLIDKAKEERIDPDDPGNFILGTLIHKHLIDVFEYFLGLTKNINRKDRDGYTALMHACSTINHSFIEKLLSQGADVNIKDKTGHTAMFYYRISQCGIARIFETNEKELEKFVKMLNSGKTFIARKIIPISKKLCYKNAIFCEDYYFDKFMKKGAENIQFTIEDVKKYASLFHEDGRSYKRTSMPLHYSNGPKFIQHELTYQHIKQHDPDLFNTMQNWD